MHKDCINKKQLGAQPINMLLLKIKKCRDLIFLDITAEYFEQNNKIESWISNDKLSLHGLMITPQRQWR